MILIQKHLLCLPESFVPCASWSRTCTTPIFNDTKLLYAPSAISFPVVCYFHRGYSIIVIAWLFVVTHTQATPYSWDRPEGVAAMLTPAVANAVTQFYPVGNTPATSLTSCLPQGTDANILLLGCGDLRNILFTAYSETGFRKFRCLSSQVEPPV